MSDTHELIISSELLLYPAEHAPTAVEHLSSADFLAPRCKLVFDAVTALWRIKPQLTPDDALEMVVRLAEQRYGASRAEGLGCAEWVMAGSEATLYDEMVPDEPHPFGDRCQILRNDNTIHRMREIVGRWYVTLFGKTGDAQKLAEELIDEIQGELARTTSGGIHTG